MEKAKVYLFTSPTCPHCPAAKRFIAEFKKSREDFYLIDVSTITNEGQRLASKFNVMSVPTFIIKGSAFPDPIGLRGVQSEKSMNKYLDMALGIKNNEPEKIGFRERLRQGFKVGKIRIKV